MSNIISRKEAIALIGDIINNYNLSREEQYKLSEIALCIDAEQQYLHIWNTEEEVAEYLYAESNTDESALKMINVFREHYFNPSKYEMKNN